MGIFSFFRKKKTEQITPVSKCEFKQTENPDNTVQIAEEDITIVENDMEIIIPVDDDAIEELEPDIYEELEDYDPTLDLSNYCFPSVNLLKVYEDISADTEEVEQIQAKITSILQINNIEIISINANVGYVNTLYEIVPKAGFRIARIKQLKTDLAFALLVSQLTIEPIMERGVIGIIIPNKNFQILPLQALIASRGFQESDFELPLIMGRTMKVQNFIVDLTVQPHILIAWKIQ
ncbi:DNA translocase FtsK [Dysgonomonas termitidis]|uniref:DNA translocase FtsK n=1 Tax=Dysgonomonas termitidis TaxID=1516126 RepID=A0ABV9KZR5_9BACT